MKRDWLQIFSNLAIVVGLILVVIELNQNAVGQRAQAYNDILERQITLASAIYEDDEFTQIWSDAAQEGKILSPINSVRYTFYVIQLMQHYEDTLLQYRAGIIEPGAWLRQRNQMGGITGQPGFQSWWAASKEYFTPDFVEVVDQMEPLKPVHQDPETGVWRRTDLWPQDPASESKEDRDF